tara:strand:- start:285 stop:395 length:111 start_codon:yes stop_codon:yes gene_type:complete
LRDPWLDLYVTEVLDMQQYRNGIQIRLRDFFKGWFK